MRNLTLLLLILSLASCVTQRKCDRKFPAQTMVITNDSIIRTTQTIYRDTTVTVYVKGDTVVNYVQLIKGATVKPSTLHTSLATSTAWVENGKLHHELIQNEQMYQFNLDNAIRLTWSSAERFYNKKEVQVKTERFIPKWVWWVLAFGLIALLSWVLKIIAYFKVI